MDLPPAVYRHARELAVAQGRSLSAVVADLTIRGLGLVDEPIVLRIDPESGFPVLSLGRRVTSDDVAAALDDALIGATALVHGMAVVSRNISDFARFDGLTSSTLGATHRSDRRHAPGRRWLPAAPAAR